MEWQPIETAPKNGKPVLLFLAPPLDTNRAVGWIGEKTLSVVVGWWAGYRPEDDKWQCGVCEEGTADTEGYSSCFQIDIWPSHWMPLPSRPQRTKRRKHVG